MTEFWDQDLSANAFSTLAGQVLRMHAVKEGYELTTDGPIEGHPQLVSAALVLNRRLQPVRATLRVRAGNNVHELRFVQAIYERKPRAFGSGYDVRSRVLFRGARSAPDGDPSAASARDGGKRSCAGGIADRGSLSTESSAC